MPSNHLILCHPLLLLPSIFPSIRVFSNKSALHIRWSKDWSFSFSISPSNEYSGLISFRIDSFDLLAIQGTLKSPSQFESINSLALNLLYGPTFTPIHDYWKKHSSDYTDFCWQSLARLFTSLISFNLHNTLGEGLTSYDYGPKPVPSLMLQIKFYWNTGHASMLILCIAYGCFCRVAVTEIAWPT